MNDTSNSSTTGEHKLNLEAWQSLAQEDPNQIVDRFYKKYEQLTTESRKAFIATCPDRERLLKSLESANELEDEPTAGISYMLQDMFDIKDLHTRCGAPFGEPFEATMDESCLLVESLENRGATCLAKTVPSEFGVDLSGHNQNFGDCPHAFARRYVCGGGAGTSAHAVANGWAPIAFGLDTCGGIRIPAAFHGLFGFRMEHNNFARDGVFPIVPSLDAVGWVTANLEDLLSSFELFYELPAASEDQPTPRGYLLDQTMQNLSSETKAGLMELLRPLDVDDEPANHGSLAQSLRKTTLAFKTIRNRELHSVHKFLVDEYSNYYDPQLLKKIEVGRTYSPAESEEASVVQQNLRANLMTFFQEYDYLVMPISPLASPDKTEWDSILEEDLTELISPLSLSFLPALILPYRCSDGKFNAAQLILNPRKLQLIPQLLEQAREYYTTY